VSGPQAADHADRHFRTDHLRADLKARSVRGGALLVGGQAGRFALRLGSTMLLARVLGPDDFGLLAMVTAVTGFVALFKDMGLPMATVQGAEIRHEQVSALFWMNAGLSVATLAAASALAPILAWFYGEPRLLNLTLVLSWAFVLTGLSAQHHALLRRRMRFAALAGVDSAAMLAGIAAALAAAWQGAGYWALVLQQLVAAFVTAVCLWGLCDWRPSAPRRAAGIRSLLGFGASLTGFNSLNHLARNLDNVLIGWALGAPTLGLYSKAYQVLLLPLGQLNGPLSAVAIPALSGLRGEPERYRRYYAQLLSLIAWITLPPIACMAVLADPLIAILLGPRWGAAAPIFQVLALAALFQPLADSTSWLYVSRGRTDRMLRWGLIASPLILLSFAAGLPWGALGVAASYAICVNALLLPLFAFAFAGSPVALRDLSGALARPLLAAAAAALGCAWAQGAPAADALAWRLLAGAGGGALGLLAAGLAWPAARRELRGLLEALALLRAGRRATP
jgi:PST family polysaccharide transporter